MNEECYVTATLATLDPGASVSWGDRGWVGGGGGGVEQAIGPSRISGRRTPRENVLTQTMPK